MQGLEPAKSHFQRVGQGGPAGPLHRQNKQDARKKPLQQSNWQTIDRSLVDQPRRSDVAWEFAVVRAEPLLDQPLPRTRLIVTSARSRTAVPPLPAATLPLGRSERPVRQDPRRQFDRAFRRQAVKGLPCHRVAAVGKAAPVGARRNAGGHAHCRRRRIGQIRRTGRRPANPDPGGGRQHRPRPLSRIARGSRGTSRFFRPSAFIIRLNSTSSSGSDTRTGSFIARFDTSIPSRPKEIRDQIAFAKMLVGVDANAAEMAIENFDMAEVIEPVAIARDQIAKAQGLNADREMLVVERLRHAVLPAKNHQRGDVVRVAKERAQGFDEFVAALPIVWAAAADVTRECLGADQHGLACPAFPCGPRRGSVRRLPAT